MAFLLTSCNQRKVYDSYQHTSLTGWEKNIHAEFSIPPLKEGGPYQSTVGLRINGDYPFMSVTLIIEQEKFAKGKPQPVCSRDTINCRLVNENGKAEGRGLTYYQYLFPLKIQELAAEDSLHISIQHNMKREILPGISDVGWRLEKRF
ncbi:MAG: gliding motility lipoprotein GldH [Prevotella sp.]|nr:gliding motility lipoprotein GldH [Prevotella sp.]